MTTPAVPEVSVIVPVYNQERFLGRCIRSLLGQSLERLAYEIIVVDDGSTDHSNYAASLFDGEVRLFRNDRNLGLPASLNRAIRESRAPAIVRVDADDYVNAHFLLFLHEFLRHNEYMDAVACDYLLVDDRENWLERVDCTERPIACGIMFRKDQLIDIGLYDEEFLRHEDQDLRIRFLKKYGIARLELPLYRYRRHDGNMTNDVKAMRHHHQRLKRKHGGAVS